MSVFNWPDGRAYRAATLEWQELDNDRSSTSQLNGSTQTVAIPGLRRAVTLSFPTQHVRERRLLEAFVRRLNGSEHKALCAIPQLEFRYSGPTGNWTPGGVTVSGAVAQHQASLTLAGCRGQRNRLLASQAFDAAQWTKENSASVTANADVAPDGTSTADRILLPTGALSRVWQTVPGLAGYQSTFEIWLKSNTGSSISGVQLHLREVGFGTTYASFSYTVGPSWTKCSVNAVIPGGSTGVMVMIYHSSIGAPDWDLLAWGAQAGPVISFPEYEPYAQATPGDWLQVPTSTGNQLLQVVSDATANDAGQMTVEVQPMLRGSVSSGAAVELASPGAVFQLSKRPNFPREQGGWCGPMSIELVEFFAS